MYVEVPEVSQKSKFLFIIITCTVLCLLLPVAAPLLLSFFIGMAVKEAKINKYTELLEEGLSYFGTFFLGLILGVLCEASTILNPTVIIILVIGILALAISAVGGLLGGWLMYLVHKAKREDFNPTMASPAFPACPPPPSWPSTPPRMKIPSPLSCRWPWVPISPASSPPPLPPVSSSPP